LIVLQFINIIEIIIYINLLNILRRKHLKKKIYELLINKTNYYD